MSDKDLIRRGDAFAACRPMNGSNALDEAAATIAALPAVTVGVDPRIINLNAEALAEIKATVDGQSDQPVKAIIYGLLAEIAALNNTH